MALRMAVRPKRARSGQRILAADVELPLEQAPVPREAVSARLRSLQRAVARGDQIHWTHFTLPSSAARSCDSSVEEGSAKVELADPGDDFVIVKKPGGRKQIQIPREHITERHPQTASALATEEVAENANAARPTPTRRATKRQRRAPEPSPAIEPPETPAKELVEPSVPEEHAPVEEQLDYLRKQLEYTKFQHAKEVADLRGSIKQEQKRKSSWKVRLQSKRIEWAKKKKKKNAKIAELDQKLERDPEQPLYGEDISLKAKKRLPNRFRDLVVDLQVVQGYPSHTAIDTVEMVLTAAGATVTNAPTSVEMPTRCLAERDVILFDDQCRRMAEASRDGPEREIRSADWDKEEKALRREKEQDDVQAWESVVAAQIVEWRTKLNYKPDRDLPSPAMYAVGEEAESEAECKEAKCAMLFCGCDGTTHGRCVCAGSSDNDRVLFMRALTGS